MALGTAPQPAVSLPDLLGGLFAPKPRIVFLGDSITQMWPAGDPQLFRGPRANAGIPGETTREMAARFDRDVIAAAPAIVHIMGGTNDLWHGEPGRHAAQTFAHIEAMLAAARAAGIAVVLAPPPPISPAAQALLRYPELLKPMMAGIAALGRKPDVTYVDYAEALSGGDGTLRPDFTTDGIHLTTRGYRAMRRQAERALRVAAAARRDHAPG